MALSKWRWRLPLLFIFLNIILILLTVPTAGFCSGGGLFLLCLPYTLQAVLFINSPTLNISLTLLSKFSNSYPTPLVLISTVLGVTIGIYVLVGYLIDAIIGRYAKSHQVSKLRRKL